MSINAYISIILNGMLIGGVYGLSSSAFTFQVGALKLTNFAYGASLAFAMYLTYFILKIWNMPWVITIVLVLAAMFVLGWFMRKTVLSKLDRGTQILCSMGAQLIVFNAVILIFTAYPRDLAIIETRIQLADKVSIGVIQLACFIISGLVLIGFHLFLKHTWTGKAIKAVVQKKDIANLMGIKSDRMLDLAFSLSYVMIGLAGIMLMLMFQVDPSFGNYMQLIAFVVCIVAGLGNLTGAYLTGIIVGVGSALINGVIGAQFHDPLLFSVFIVILLLRPNGIFTSKSKVARKI